MAGILVSKRGKQFDLSPTEEARSLPVFLVTYHFFRTLFQLCSPPLVFNFSLFWSFLLRTNLSFLLKSFPVHVSLWALLWLTISHLPDTIFFLLFTICFSLIPCNPALFPLHFNISKGAKDLRPNLSTDYFPLFLSHTLVFLSLCHSVSLSYSSVCPSHQ